VQHSVAVAAVLACGLLQAFSQSRIAIAARAVAQGAGLMPISLSAWRSLRPSPCNCRTTSRRAATATIFLERLAHRVDLEHRIGQQPFELAVLGLEGLPGVVALLTERTLNRGATFLRGQRSKYKSLTDHEKRLLKRRQAIELLIGHTKSDHRMGRCWLQGAMGDAAACAELCRGLKHPLAAAGDHPSRPGRASLRPLGCDRVPRLPAASHAGTDKGDGDGDGDGDGVGPNTEADHRPLSRRAPLAAIG
jgi:hypothetical protein